MNLSSHIAVVGLWHLGCVTTAAWLKKGQRVIGVDWNPKTIDALSSGKAPLYEPYLDETLQEALANQKVIFSAHPASVQNCEFVFLTYDTPVDESDQYDLSPLEDALTKICPHLSSTAILIVSSQVPVGTCKRWEKQFGCSIAYSPENLRLGEAIAGYLNPGHIVIGSDRPNVLEKAKKLFSTISATYLTMNLCSAEMTKHAINSFLASSITFANQLSDACNLAGANFQDVTHAMKQDPRIGKKAYVKAGIGFSGGTLGRDLRILSQLNSSRGGGTFPFFQELWQHNRQRPRLLVHKIGKVLGEFSDKTIGILGITYKPGTSTLRRSLPLEMARDFVRRGAHVKVYDPKADWSEEKNLEGIGQEENPYEIGKGADFLLVLTEWPEFKELDFERLGAQMKQRRLFDPHGYFIDQYPAIKSYGFEIFHHLL